MSRPWMPFYVGDYLRDTGNLGALEHGAYLLLILHYWQHEGLPDDEEELAAICRLTMPEWEKARRRLSRFFHDGWKHKRIDAELAKSAEKYAKRAEAGKKGAESKWGSDTIGKTTRAERLKTARLLETHTELEWQAMLGIFGGCVKCQTRHADLHGNVCCKDHIVPIVKGGSDGIENIQPLCRQCNSKKSSFDTTDYRAVRVFDWRERMADALADAKQMPSKTPDTRKADAYQPPSPKEGSSSSDTLEPSLRERIFKSLASPEGFFEEGELNRIATSFPGVDHEARLKSFWPWAAGNGKSPTEIKAMYVKTMKNEVGSTKLAETSKPEVQVSPQLANSRLTRRIEDAGPIPPHLDRRPQLSADRRPP